MREYKPKMIDCPECDGTGLVTAEVGECEFEDDGDWVFIPDEVEIVCSNCDGVSFVELSIEDQVDLEEYLNENG